MAFTYDVEDPIRDELLSTERLEQVAESLAAGHATLSRPGSDRRLARRLGDNGRLLRKAYRTLNEAVREENTITPAAEWLIDNFHHVESQVHEIREDLPPGFYRELPKLARGEFRGYPRVLALAWTFVAHTDSRFDPQALSRFVQAYQRVQALTIGELWAVTITLRIVLVENLRRVAEHILRGRAARRAADALADRLLGIGCDIEPAEGTLRTLARYPLQAAFAVQLAQRLRDQDPRVMPALHWLDERLAAQGTTADRIVLEEHQRQGAMNVTVRNAITSMRLVSTVDWPHFFEEVSLVDTELRAGSAFADMDFPTRDRYRRAIEELSRGSRRPELEVARAALRAADGGARDTGRERDPGYHLISKGRPALEAQLGFRPSLKGRLFRTLAAAGVSGYLALLALTTAALLASLLFCLASLGVHGQVLAALALLALFPAMDAAMALVNHVVMRGIGPTSLPGLALRDGVPESLRTLVVVPTLLTTPEEVELQVERLEVHYLASPDGDLRFALLSDWIDAATESAPGDGELLEAARDGIARLNRRHQPAADGDRFLLLHRQRVWNAGELKWIGWERKRGKLHELNRLLRGATDTTFLAVGPAVPSGVKYVITLDADTRLPRNAAKRLIGKMAHPINQPKLDRDKGRVVEGYAVLQPRVTPSMPGDREGSLFQRVFSSASGMDPYAFAVSDVYQDLFGEGSYSGKGIYEVDAFEAALAGRIPENSLLSHDLLEGIFARAGLVSDIEVVEEFPTRYNVDAARHHRWARGDWQLMPWPFGRGASPPGSREHDSIPLLGRWKMFDNLRRTLSAPIAFLALLAGWSLPLPAAATWTAIVIALMATPALLPWLAGILPRRQGIMVRSHLRAVRADFLFGLARIAFQLAVLPHQAWLMADAIVRTLRRMFGTRRRLLEWVTDAQATIKPRLDLVGFYRQMGGGVGLAATALPFAAVAGGSGSLLVAAPLLLLWLLAPAIAHWVSLPLSVAGNGPLPAEDALALRLVARRTWRFFEAFVTGQDHMLPPDNYQEEPRPVVAHRTSPTNMGLYLLSVVAAADFGWLGLSDATERLEATLGTMTRLPRFRGHFYNWYDTQTLGPLEPRYISSVDSGNLAGHLIALANACREWARRPAFEPSRLEGIGDALWLVRQAHEALADDKRGQIVTRRQLTEALDALFLALGRVPELAELAGLADTLCDIARTMSAERGDLPTADLLSAALAVRASIASHARDGERVIQELAPRLAGIALLATELAGEMEFGFLLDPDRQLLSIGFAPAEERLDPSCYDLLASEARLASFLAIAKGDVPARHWFRLGRAVTPVNRDSALLSWSGSMFEYLMPALVMDAPAGSQMEQTMRLVISRQRRYGAEMGVPWGISESAYNARDLEFTYQYSNFGIPDLGLKRGLSRNLVVAPYATGLAAMFDPAAAAQNYARLAGVGGRGWFGWYEALDYTPSRVPKGQAVAVVRAYMAHHQGMTLVAIANALHGGAMRARFHAEPLVQATELLLQERVPRDVAVARSRVEDVKIATDLRDLVPPVPRRFVSPHDLTPRTHVLSNGRYAVMLTSAGSGYSRCGDLDVTRWREDVTCDAWGSYIYLRDARSGDIWSAGYQPSGTEPDDYEVIYSEHRADIVRRDGSLTTKLEVVVSPEDDAEVRRVSITNFGSRPRELEITSYAEVVLAPRGADMAHPAFSKLFLQTEYEPAVGALLATRRRRAPTEPEVWAAHLASVEGEAIGEPEYETDRARFLGRGRDVRTAISVVDGGPLSGTVGTVLDPVFSLRQRLRIQPGATARVAFWTLIAPSRRQVLDLADRHRDGAAFERTLTLAWTQAQVQLHHLGIGHDEAHLFQRLANRVIYSDPTLRPPPDVLARSDQGPSALWSHGISGDLPLVVCRIDKAEDLDIVRQLLAAHAYWRMKQIAVDLVILNESAPSYDQDLQSALEALLRAHQPPSSAAGEAARGEVFILRGDLMSAAVRGALLCAARAVLLSRQGTLAEQLKRILAAKIAGAPPAPRRPANSRRHLPAPPRQELEFFNGLGGFAAGGTEYVTVLAPGQWTPAPWINVVANPVFGFQTSVEGCGYTWSVNSKERQLTPWSNDPISDRPGEVFYLRDEESGEVWSPTALPIRLEGATYLACHGQGYSRFEHASSEIWVGLMQYVAPDDPVKISRLTIRNLSDRQRRLSITAYIEWVLGASRTVSASHVVTEVDPGTGAMLARNPWSHDFGGRVAFVDLGGRHTTWTGDRTEFLGRNGTLSAPAALETGAPLSNQCGAGLDPCGALQTRVVLNPGEIAEIVCYLGDAGSRTEATDLIARYRNADLEAIFRATKARWEEMLGVVQVKTPDRSMDLLLNRWLVYQTLACRLWARSAFYQAGGAYGFRDQLQDVLALAVPRPDLVREHLLRAAGRQFGEGDVQHWWLPQAGHGVRTRISDDRIWLPYAVAHYVEITGDAAVLDERVPFLDGPLLREGQHEAYFQPTVTGSQATLFEHCARALDASLAVGRHGLPLMGTGDWNDGMNRVGEAGMGESSWLGWFLHATLTAMAALAAGRGEAARSAAWRAHAASLGDALEQQAWDGDWYLRGYFDDGTPLGSRESAECQIDAIAQSWSVISGAADKARAVHAMAASESRLVRRDDGLILLFDPPFDRTPLEPGYIKGYPPGIRENGGQYTHAAVWTLIAFALLGDGDKAAELFGLLDPIAHARTRAGVQRYKVEPYVVAADVYSQPPHVGRGGWTWYTGSAAWLYRAGLESILGFRLQGPNLLLDPCIPRAWPGFEIAYRYHGATYVIAVENPRSVCRGVTLVELDGQALAGTGVPLVDDGGNHRVRVVLG